MPSERRIRVLQIIGALYYGGAEKVVTGVALGVDRSRFEMMVCCTRAFGPLAEAIRAADIPLVLGGPQTRVQRYLGPLHLARQIRRLQPDVIHTHALPGLVDVGPIAWLGQTPPWIHTFHYGNYPYANKRYMLAERLFCRRADTLVAVAEAQRLKLIEHHRIAPERIVTRPNGVRDNPFLDTPGVRERKRAELGLAADDIVVGTIAVLSVQKGVTYLLKAMSGVLRRMPHAKLVVVGGGDQEDALKAEAAALGLGSSVVFAGWRNDVGELLLAFDVWVMSSLWEAMPLALIEAMASGRPIVVTDVGDNGLIVDRGAVARLVPAADAEALATAISGLLADPPGARALGAAARQRFLDRFTVAQMVAGYERLYAEMARSPA
jgi:glycosyltransferase involved in cell wall biosynthesis